MPPLHIEHVNDDREAYAPYNFVPLPATVVPAEHKQPLDQSRFHPGLHSGRIAYTVTTSSPLYIRAGQSAADFTHYDRTPFHDLPEDVKERRAAFFHTDTDGTPVIPGSSLRGMLRTLVEIAAFGKLDRVIDRQLFYRSVNDQNYRQEFVAQVGPNTYQAIIRTGFLRRNDDGYVIEECESGRIERNATVGVRTRIPVIPGQPLMLGNGPNQRPNWAYQNRPIYVTVDPEANHFFHAKHRPNGQLIHPDLYLRFRAVTQASWNPFPGAQTGTLVITGHMQNKHMEFVFLQPAVGATRYQLPEEMIRRFEDDDQLTQWQEGAFPSNQPTAAARTKPGGLRVGEPVFFLMNANGTVRFFGRAQLFRLPFGHSPADLVQYDAATPELDIAEALFGVVRPTRREESGAVQALAGRVSVSDARCISPAGEVWLTDQRIVPKLLGAPKPTTYQHYLVQGNTNQRQLRQYNSPRQTTTIRGFKHYWHKGAVGAADITAEANAVEAAPSQYTGIRPVRAGVRFSGELHFENLSSVELGALLWVLKQAADPRYRLKLGMGKPYGMGAIAIDSTTFTTDIGQRYGNLFTDTDDWHSSEQQLDQQRTAQLIADFERYVLTAIGNNRASAKLADTDRIRSLLALLSWPGPDSAVTRYMEIARNPELGHRPGRRNAAGVNEYSDRLVLPRPEQVLAENPAPAAPAPAAAPAAALPDYQQAAANGLRLTGQCVASRRWLFNGTWQMMTRLNLKADQLRDADGLVFLTAGAQTGGFGGVIAEIDDSNPQETLIRLIRTPRPNT